MVVDLHSLAPHSVNGDAFQSVYTDGTAQRLALEAIWQAQFSVAVDLVSNALADNPEGDARFVLYRLWIEALAESQDRSSLVALGEHLFVRGQADPVDHTSYAALRGLVHFELDEFEGARLLAGTMDDYRHNPYCMELVQLVTSRTGKVSAETMALLNSTVALDDYFHWQAIVRGFISARDGDALNQVIDIIKEGFRNSPLPQLCEYHRCIDSGFYAGAALVAGRLREMYANNINYHYFYAYALFEDGDYPAARNAAAAALSLSTAEDAELVALLGHCHAKLGDSERASHYLQQAVETLANAGLPTSHVQLELANVEEELRGDELDPKLDATKPTRMWLVNLSPRRCYELQTSSDLSVERLLRPMGAEPYPGDFCFFASADKSLDEGPSSWKIAAIYTVDSLPLWHPTYRYHTALRLVCRLPRGIPVDIQLTDDAGGAKPQDLDRDHPFTFGVFELELGALDVITEAIKQHNEDLVERRKMIRARPAV